MYISETHSTSTLLRESYNEQLPHLYYIRADYQTAGRGQTGNSWESERGKNLLYSSLLKYPNLHATEQWRLSMLVAITWWEVLKQHLPQEHLTIKWPNDIYYQDKKLVGILIENILQGIHIGYTIAGVGVNINQTEWRSNAPNPISMKEITGKEYNIDGLLNEWICTMKSWENRKTEELSSAYLQRLYRREGWHEYVEREVSIIPTALAEKGTKDTFLAEIVTVTTQGELILRLQNREEKKYHFKQIRFVV